MSEIYENKGDIIYDILEKINLKLMGTRIIISYSVESEVLMIKDLNKDIQAKFALAEFKR